MGKIKDLTGQTFGRLTVVGLLPEMSKNRKALWRCRCSCGVLVPCVVGANLTGGNTTSCGCVQKKRASETQKTHGLSGQAGNAHYTRWAGIKNRTMNPNCDCYSHYGGRGIKLHQPWADSFVEFKGWLDENLGPCPDGYSIDRIDVDGNYEPDNLRWASKKTQSNNRRNSNGV